MGLDYKVSRVHLPGKADFQRAAASAGRDSGPFFAAGMFWERPGSLPSGEAFPLLHGGYFPSGASPDSRSDPPGGEGRHFDPGMHLRQ